MKKLKTNNRKANEGRNYKKQEIVSCREVILPAAFNKAGKQITQESVYKKPIYKTIFHAQ